MFPFQSDDIFRSDIRSPVLSRKSFTCTTSGPSHARFSPVSPVALRNYKNIFNCSVHRSSVSSSSSNVDRAIKPAYPVVSSSNNVTNTSKSFKVGFSPYQKIFFLFALIKAL